MSKLQLILLGRFDCLLATGTRISLAMRKAEALLAFLALAPGFRHPRERLINLLWSDRGEEQARNSLRQALSSMRKSLGDVADLILQIDRTTVSLNAELVEVDALEFERLALAGDYESLTSAADLYQGEFLEGIAIRDAACQEWLDSERQRFKRQFVEILFNLAETQLLSHDYAHAIKSAERLVEQDPLVESGWRLLMRGYFENGNRNHALQAFKRCQQVLRAELDVDPEPATVELREQITGGAIETRSAPVNYKVVSTDSDYSIAVLPFDNLSGDPEQEYFSDGITDSIILNLSLFPGLNVKSRNSSFAFKQQIKNLGEISRELNVDYIVEGSIRRAEDRVRITVQLIDTGSGNQIWGKRYDADLENLFDLEEDLSRSIAATVTGQIESDLQRIAIAKGAAEQQAYDLLLSGIFHGQRFNRQDTAIAIEKLNQCLDRDPDNVRAHVALYGSHIMDYIGRWTADYRASFRLAEQHIRRALELDPESGLVQAYYGEFLIFNRELEASAKHIDKALEINPNDPDALAIRALNLECRGDFEAGFEAAEMAVSLDPFHPWAEWEVALGQYMSGRYQDALDTIAKFRTSPGFVDLIIVAAHVKLGQTDRAHQALQEYLRACREDMLSMPQDLNEWLQFSRENYPYVDQSINRDLIDCLVRAGLEEAIASRPTRHRFDKHGIAVLPFDNLSGDPAQEYFSDGITESVIMNLSLFPGLNVKSRHSSFAFKQQIKSLGEISRELGVDYIVEGSIRRSTDRVRITVQLVDTSSGNQIWGKRYDADLENLFDLEEDLSRSIAATVTGQIGSELQRIAIAKGAADLRAYDLLLSGRHHLAQHDRTSVLGAIEEFHQCLSEDPGNALAHADLYYCHDLSVMDHWAEDVARARELATKHILKAIALDPDSAYIQVAYANHLSFTHQFDEAERQLKRVLNINPNDTEAIAMRAVCLSLRGDTEEALEQAELALKLDPYHTWARWIRSECLYFRDRFEDCLASIAEIANPPGFVRIYQVAANVGLGRLEDARKALQSFLRFCQENMPSMPDSIEAWHDYYRHNAPFADPVKNGHIIDCLLKAGLEYKVVSGSSNEAGHDQPSIAVLPFDNMSGDPEQEHFSDGITADIIDTLSKFKHLRTVARHSTLPYKADKPSIRDIAEQQGVRYILEGSVRKSGGRIRVNAELIDARDEGIVWSERYDRDLDDLFAVQDDITREITLALKVQLDDGEMARVRSKGATHIKAWEMTMAAVDLQDTYIRQNILEARALASEATRLDPGYAYAWISLGWTFWQEYYSGCSDSLDASIDEAEKAVRQARELDPEYSEAYSLAGMIHLMKHEPEAAIEDCLKAVALEPGNAELQGLTAFAYVFAGDYDRARVYDRNIRKLCPLRANWYFLIEGQIEVAAGNLQRAAEIYRQGLEVEPDSPLCRYFLIDLMVQMGDEGAARQYADELRALDASASARGIAHTYSSDPALRNAFAERLRKFDLI